MPEVPATAAPVEVTESTIAAPAPAAAEPAITEDAKPNSTDEAVAEVLPVEFTPPEIASPAQPPASSPAPEVLEQVEVAGPAPVAAVGSIGADDAAVTTTTEVASVAAPLEIPPVKAVEPVAEPDAVTVEATEPAASPPAAPVVVEEVAAVAESVTPAPEGEPVATANPVEPVVSVPEPVEAPAEVAPVTESGDGGTVDSVVESVAAEPSVEVVATKPEPAPGVPELIAEAPAPVAVEVVDAAAPAPSEDQPSVELVADAPPPAATADAPPINTESVPPAADTPVEAPAEQPGVCANSQTPPLVEACRKVADGLGISVDGVCGTAVLAVSRLAPDGQGGYSTDVDTVLKQLADTAEGRENRARAFIRGVNANFVDAPWVDRLAIAKDLEAAFVNLAKGADSEAVKAVLAEALQ